MELNTEKGAEAKKEAEVDDVEETERIENEKKIYEKRREDMRKIIAASQYCPYTKDKDGHCIPCKACTYAGNPDKQVESYKEDPGELEKMRGER